MFPIITYTTRLQRFCWSLAILCALGCTRTPTPFPETHPTPAASSVDRLLDLMRQRLLVMHQVARWKWNTRQPIADPPREQALLAALLTRSRPHQLDPAFTRAFFSAQMEAAKQLQQADFDQWQAAQHGPFADVPDLATELRPRIDALSDDLLTALATVRPFLDDAATRNLVQQRAAVILTGDGITDGIRAAAIEPLTQPAHRR